MKLATALAFLAALGSPQPADESEQSAPQPGEIRSASVPGDVLADSRTLLGDARNARLTGDLDSARAAIRAAIDRVLSAYGDRADEDAIKLLGQLATFAYELGELHASERARRRVLEALERTRPADHPDLQSARQNLAGTLVMLGDLHQARALYEATLEVHSRTLPGDHADVQTARLNLAVALQSLGELARAREIMTQVLEARSRTLPDDDEDLQLARQNLAITLCKLGDLPGARSLFQKVLEVRSRTLPHDHADLQMARQNFASVLCALGDLSAARTIGAEVLAVNARLLPDDHPVLQIARQNYAVMLDGLGDLTGARALFEKVLEVRSRTLPDDHPDLQGTRMNLAAMRFKLGDVSGARALQEQVLERSSRTLPDDHPSLQLARQHLAATLRTLGELQSARALEEKAFEVVSRSLSDDHPEHQRSRQSLAATLAMLGELDEARALQEQSVEIAARTLPDDHIDLQLARQNLAATLAALGEFDGARDLLEQVHATFSRTLPDDHPDLQVVRHNLATTVARVARETRGVAEGQPRAGELAAARERCAELVLARCRAQTAAASRAVLQFTDREAQAQCETLARGLDLALSFAAGYGVFDPIPALDRAALVLSETTRGTALGSAALTRRAGDSAECRELRARLRERTDELASIAQAGTTSDAFRSALALRDETQRDLVELARESNGATLARLEFDPESLAARIAADQVVVGFRRYVRSHVAGGVVDSASSLCALVLSRSGGHSESGGLRLTRVELGSIEPIEAAVSAWRASLGVADGRGVGVRAAPPDGQSERERAALVRRLVFDPLRPAIDAAGHVVLALDHVLHLVPIDALPLSPSADEGAEFVGERWRIELRCTLAELDATPSARPEGEVLVALGGASFDVEPTTREGAPVPLERGASILRGGPWEPGFGAIPHAAREAREISALYGEVFGDAARTIVLAGSAASRDTLEAIAHDARFLHVATHGWYASETIRSWSDPEPLDKFTGLGQRASGVDQVKGSSPMLLCGLALAGANAPDDELGRARGLITAEEISALDLSRCELAVLSACDTNVGERRAGQGVASLQQALQMAGARSVITSLWKVPDEATKLLMLDFYRRLWVEKKPKWQALWEAKKMLREAKDARGEPRYALRDWAAWVLTGEPD